MKRVATFLMRYFFACSIGFTVPVEDFGNLEVWKRASILLLRLGSIEIVRTARGTSAQDLSTMLARCVFGKICMGFFAMPLTLNEFLILGFAWGSWGEFSFILALRALRGNLLTGILAEDPAWKMWIGHVVGSFDISASRLNMY